MQEINPAPNQNIKPLGSPPENYLVWAILSTVFCCWPIGVVSIIKSSKVKELWALGDIAGAKKAADDTKKYAIWSAIALPIFFVIIFIFSMVMGVAGALLDA